MNQKPADHPERFRADAVSPESFAHTVDAIQVIETHISWVFLTGEFAYKVKKPVKLDFLDFTTLKLRKHYCDEELRLNAHLVEGLYIDVVSVGGSGAQPRFGVEPAIEYAVKMHQFEQSSRLDHLLTAGKLGKSDAVNLGEMLASMHAKATVANDFSIYGRIPSVVAPVADNYRQLFQLIDDQPTQERLRELCRKDILRLRKLRKVLTERRLHGAIRECHGDLHLANLVKFQGRVVVFDCLEFEPALRWIDVMNDVAFVYMDLLDHQAQALAFEFLNAYLEHSGDYAGLAVLDMYATYRAMVRMKIAALSPAHTDTERQVALLPYLACAESFIEHQSPVMVIMRGLSASGKSVFSGRLMTLLPAIRLRSDIERKRLAGITYTQKTHSKVGAGLYSADLTLETYEAVSDHARTVLASGYSVIIDATNLKRWQRTLFIEMAAASDVPVVIVDCIAPESVLRQRIEQRQTQADNVSEANQQVLDLQLSSVQSLSVAEQAITISVDTSQNPDATIVAAQITAKTVSM